MVKKTVHFIFILIMASYSIGYSQANYGLDDGGLELDCHECDSLFNLYCSHFGAPQKLAKYPGGFENLFLFIEQSLHSIQKYDTINVKGTLTVSFIIDATGKVICPKIVRSLHPVLDKEVIRIVKNMPDWIPAYNYEIAVSDCFTLPIKFPRGKKSLFRKKARLYPR